MWYNWVMLISGSRLRGVQVLSLHLGGPIAQTVEPVIDPNDLSVVAFTVTGPQVGRENGDILETRSVREYSRMGMIVDSADELVNRSDIIRLDEVMKLNFRLVGLKVVSKSGKKMGKVEDYTVDTTSFQIIQIIIKRPVLKGFIDPELVIGRSEIVEIDDYKIIVKDENEKALKKSGTKDFVPSFVNPFRQEPNFAPVRSQNPGEEDTE